MALEHRRSSPREILYLMKETELQSDDLLHVLGRTMTNEETTWVECKERNTHRGAKERTS